MIDEFSVPERPGPLPRRRLRIGRLVAGYFDAFHAATAETWSMTVLSPEDDYKDITVAQISLELTDE
ncbi:hypothetical protein [Halalkalicoccus tibetensis]|uniref:Uncharacterized protein n=1 Tax=Halalkalicoccus tibetensis TaxID=175632 RepID=A0ABD5V5I7_9EURY